MLAPLLASAVLAASTTPPNVVFFLVDDLGWNDVGFHGSPQIPTPIIDGLAHSGVILDNYYVNPVCSPTRGSLMSGRSMMHTGIQYPFPEGNDASGLNLTYTLLPEQLKQKNYTSYMVGKWHLGMKTRAYLPSSRGFDKYYGYYLGSIDAWKFYRGQPDNSETALALNEGGALLGHAPGADVPVYNDSGVYTSTRYAAVASNWIAAHDQSAPMFLYLAFQGIHSSNNHYVQAPPDVIAGFDDAISPMEETCGQYEKPMKGNCTKRAMRKTIAAEVTVIDDAIGSVVDALKSAGMYDNTLIIFSSDNGGPTDATHNMANNFPLRSGKGETWEGGIRAAGFIHGYGVSKTNYFNKRLHHVSDWYWTILSAAGIDTPILGEKEVPWKEGDGVDNWAAMTTDAASARTELLIANQADGSHLKAFAIRVGDMKLLWHPTLTYDKPDWYTPPGLAWNYTDSLTVKCGKPPTTYAGNKCAHETTPCLYNITADPCEHTNLATTHPHHVAHLKARLAFYKKTTILPWNNFSEKTNASLPTLHGPTTRITPDPLTVGPQTYEGYWAPWLKAEQDADYYPTKYTGPGY